MALAPELERLIGNPSRISLKYLYGRNLQHSTAARVRWLAPIRYRRYFSFAFVRNPWDRMLSEYKWRQSWDEEVAGAPFEAMLSNLPRYRRCREPHFREASDFLFDRSNQLMVDSVGRFESIATDFAQICSTLKAVAPLSRSNASREEGSRSYRDYYGKESRELVADWFRNDIVRFEYRF